MPRIWPASFFVLSLTYHQEDNVAVTYPENIKPGHPPVRLRGIFSHRHLAPTPPAPFRAPPLSNVRSTQNNISAQPRERKLVTVEPKAPNEIERPVWLPTERARKALRELQERELLQLTIVPVEDEIDFVNSYKNVDPDSIATYFDSLSPLVYSFYRYPGTAAVGLIWPRHGGVISVKHIQAQNGVRKDIIVIAEQEGIKVAKTIKVRKQGEISGEQPERGVILAAERGDCMMVKSS